MPIDIVSALDAVTVYKREAVCVRRGRVAPGGERLVRFVGLPLALRAASLRGSVIEGPPGLRVLDVQAGFDVVLGEDIDVPAEGKALEAAVDEQERLSTALERLEADIGEMESLRPKLPDHKRPETPREAPVAAMLALTDLVDERLAAKHARRRDLRAKLEDAHEAVALRRRRLAEASSALSSARTRVQRTAVATLSDAVEGAVVLALEYVVPGVRWAPSYELRLEPGLAAGTLKMRAAIAQATGEDWSGVTLSLSTASLSRSAEVPVLKALKIGRAQPAPALSGWREPPAGLDELFESYDRAQADRPAPRPSTVPRDLPDAAYDDEGEVLRRAAPERARAPKKGGKLRKPSATVLGGVAAGGVTGAYAMPPPAAAAMAAPPSPPAPSPAMDMEVMASMVPQPKAMFRAAARASAPEEAEGAAEEIAAEPPPEPSLLPQASLMDYEHLVMPAPDEGGGRGRLRPAQGTELAMHVNIAVNVDILMSVVVRAQQGAGKVDLLPLPGRCQEAAPLDHFDYRYDCAHRVDVPSTGVWATVPVTTCAVGLRPSYVAVPAVEARVYRTLELRNTSGHALLPGPVDVSVGDELLLTSVLPGLPPGAEGLRLGLGVEEAVKIARQTRFRESSGGLLGGKSVLVHEIEVELNNRLGAPVPLEVRERVPVPEPGLKDVEVEETPGRPAWEKVDEPVDGALVPGLRRWRVTLAAGQRLVLGAQYSVRIPSDKVLVGGNRRG